MESLLYFVALGGVKLVQALPLLWAARFGRTLGALAFTFDRPHRRVALANLQLCFGATMTSRAIRALGKENFRRIGENFACAVKTAAMGWEELSPHVEFAGSEKILAALRGDPPQRVIAAIGHFGNFELYARFGQFAPGLQCATTYRGLRHAGVDRLMQSLRQRSGCLFFERRFDAQALRQFMNQPRALLGLLADQHAGESGIRLPFLGHDCSTSAAPAVLALRYDCLLLTGFCYRVGLARWRIEVGEEIPLRVNGRARPIAEIMLEVNRAFDQAVRRDPANWFWVHKRWKTSKKQRAAATAASQSASLTTAAPPRPE